MSFRVCWCLIVSGLLLHPLLGWSATEEAVTKPLAGKPDNQNKDQEPPKALFPAPSDFSQPDWR